MGEVGDVEQQGPLLVVGVGGLFVERGNFLADAAHPGFEVSGGFAEFAFAADFLAQTVAVGVVGLEGGLDPAAARVAGQDFLDLRRRVGPAARGEAGFDEVGLFADETDVEHRVGQIFNVPTAKHKRA